MTAPLTPHGDALAAPLPDTSGPILALDVGSVNTRVLLMEVVAGGYRFVARGEAPTTSAPPWNDVLVGVYDAIMQVSVATGRQLLDSTNSLLMPEEGESVGIDRFVATASAGESIRAVLVGLMPDLSLASGRRAADSIYLQIADTFSLIDGRTMAQRIDALLAANPDLVILVGGTDGGASGAIRQQLDTILLAFSLLDGASRPPLLYAGNEEMANTIEAEAAERSVQVLTARNVRPSLGTEYLDDAQARLATLYSQQRSRSAPGMAEIVRWSERGLVPTARGFGALVHILAGLNNEDVLGIDLGSRTTAIAAWLAGEPYLNVFGQLGAGHSIREAFEAMALSDVMRWITEPAVTPEDVRDYVWNRWLYPHAVPATPGDMCIAAALARELLTQAVQDARLSWRSVPPEGPLPRFDTLLLSGATLARSPGPGWSLLVAIDALLPEGRTRVLLDHEGLAPALGALAPAGPEAVVQMLDSGALAELGTVIATSGEAQIGETALEGTLTIEETAATVAFSVEQGDILRLPLPAGTHGEIHVEGSHAPLEGLGRRRRITVSGGELGVILDARGRPLPFSRDATERRRQGQLWRQALSRER